MTTPTSGGPSRLSNANTASYYLAGNAVAATGFPIFVAPYDCKIIDVRAKVKTAPTGATLIADVNKNGTTVFTTQANRPTIAISATASSTTLPDVRNLVAGDVITVDVDQIGSTVAGAELLVQVTVE